MNTELYQKLALDFYNDDHRHCNNLESGLLEETHEVIEAIKTGTRQEYLDELADVLWYITIMADCEGSSLKGLMERNYYKLEARAINGK